jgi:hypothetical protein
LSGNTSADTAYSMAQATKELAAGLLEGLEAKIGSAAFIGAYSAVQRRIQSSKAEKRRQLAAEAVVEPQAYAARKVRFCLFSFVFVCCFWCICLHKHF